MSQSPQSPITQEEQQALIAAMAEPLPTINEIVGIKGPEPLMRIDAEDEVEKMRDMTPYGLWKFDPSSENLHNVVVSLKPTIDSAVASMGGGGNPQIASKARVIAAKAVKSYKPEAGATLGTWVSQQLRQLTRDIRKSNSIIPIPDGAMLDAYTLYKAEQELIDELDREPSVEELADRSHFSIKRIESIRKKMRPTQSEGSLTEGGNNLIEGSQSDFSKDALDYVYADSDLMDKKLLEYTTGYGGTEQLDNDAIMKKLKLTPVQLTRRKQRLSMRVKQIIDDLEEVAQ